MFDRDVQRDILERLNKVHPYHMLDEDYVFFDKMGRSQFFSTLIYLEEHGLLVSGITIHPPSSASTPHKPKITAKGIDFIVQDGGLSAILNTVTVKFHDESLKKIADFIAISDLSPQDKQKFSSVLQGLPSDATKHLVTRLIDLGLDQAPRALEIIKNCIQSL